MVECGGGEMSCVPCNVDPPLASPCRLVADDEEEEGGRRKEELVTSQLSGVGKSRTLASGQLNIGRGIDQQDFR